MNWILDLIRSLFSPPVPVDTGLVLDDPRETEKEPQYELLFGATARRGKRLQGMPSKDWRALCPPFRNQGNSNLCTAYSGTSIGSIFEAKENGSTVLFSPLELFYRTGGNIRGNSLLSTAKGMEEALVLDADVPTPASIPAWDYSGLKVKAKATPEELDKGRRYRMKSHTFVSPDPETLHRALSSSPVYMAIGIGSGYWNDPAPATWRYSCYHAVVLTSIDADGNFVIFDSLTYRQGFSGFHKLAWNYPIQAAIAFVDLPDGWQDKQETAKNTDYSFCLGHYGKKRSLETERLIADSLVSACKLNPTVSSYMGPIWTVCVNAVAYGGYSVTDLLNHFTSIRRGKGPIFDFNQLRTH